MSAPLKCIDMEKLKQIYGEPISVYTEEQGLKDGVLHFFGRGAGNRRLLFTDSVMGALAEGGNAEKRPNLERLTDLFLEGFEALREPDEEDSEYMKLRKIQRGRFWVIEELGKITLMLPSDY
ncbi:MAG: hypothetical protein V1676_02745 [Candidatus Diapherotrites archaeon]